MAQHSIVTLKHHPDARVALMWLPHSGGSAAYFQELSNALPDSIECLAAEYPGRGRRFREPLCSDLAALIRDIAAAYASLPKNRPVIMFGHSLGALVGFELCRYLGSIGPALRPKLLVVSACEPPHIERSRPLLHKLPDDELVDTLIGMSGETFVSELAKDLMLINLKVIRSDLTLGETHRFSPLPTLGGDLAVYGGTRDNVVRHSTLAQWKDLSSGSLKLRDFEGGHFYMQDLSDEFVVQLSHDVLSAVEELTSEQPLLREP
ncbi:thioesterase [Sphingomonas gei]|uniref:Thioesterase n=1 Tax=Sphingomonas gei TaxID=1395960 RepID=A0A4S1X1M9_9SPHN|nr:alpha/beta fold hydrolase [Sphingomonas gei]TGX48670.1 thioesterase [Sphingomonas gei]